MRNRAKRRTWTLMISKNDIRGAVGLAFLLIAQIPAAGISFAEEIPPSLYSEMKWRMIGPFRAGKVNGVTGVPGNPAIYYLGADGGGIWKTTDGGVTWKPIFDGEFAASIGAIESEHYLCGDGSEHDLWRRFLRKRCLPIDRRR